MYDLGRTADAYVSKLGKAGFSGKTLELISLCTRALLEKAGENAEALFFSEDSHKNIRDFLKENEKSLSSYPYEIHLSCAELFSHLGRECLISGDVPPGYPSDGEIEKILTLLYESEDYKALERERKQLFRKDLPENGDPDSIRKKAAFIAKRYGHRIGDLNALSLTLAGKDLDRMIENGMGEAVERIAACVKNDGYGFGSRYCRCHRPGLFPLYSKAAVKALKFFRDTCHKGYFLDADLKNYGMYKRVLSVFLEVYEIKKFGLSELSLFLDQVGRQL